MSAPKFWTQSGDWWIIIIHDVILVSTSGIDKNQNGAKEKSGSWGHLSSYLKLEPEQRNAVESFLNHDVVLAVLPTGYGKSHNFQLFAVAASIERKYVLVVCPLKSIIEDQIAEAESMGIPAASAVDISEDEFRAAI